ncbi:MAG TPA: hypothetical protein DCM14_00605 [Clostridiales bacterium UBA8153]|nr:hypothetical protein [Clostridiales bacterium UBA8153]
MVFMLMVIAVLMLFGVTALSVSLNEYALAHRQSHSVQAFFLAEAGIAHSMAALRREGRASLGRIPHTAGSFPELGTYATTISGPDAGGHYLIRSEGRAREVTQTVQARVLVQTLDHFLQYGLWAGGTLTGDKNANLTFVGNVRLGGNLESDHHVHAPRVRVTSGHLSLGGVIDGAILNDPDNRTHLVAGINYSVHQNGFQLPDPFIIFAYREQGTPLAGTRVRGGSGVADLDHPLLLESGNIVYWERTSETHTLRLKDGIQGSGILVVIGDLELQDDVKPVPGPVAILVTGNITTTGASRDVALDGLLYAAGTIAGIRDLTVNGSVVAGGLELRGDLDIRQDLAALPPGHTLVTVVEWFARPR